jgi:hypothetical protein
MCELPRRLMPKVRLTFKRSAMVGEVDVAEEAKIDWASIRADPINEIEF